MIFLGVSGFLDVFWYVFLVQVLDPSRVWGFETVLGWGKKVKFAALK